MRTLPLVLATAVTAVATPLSAQIQRGFMTASPVGMSFASGSSSTGVTYEPPRVKKEGLSAELTDFYSPPGIQDYQLEAMFDALWPVIEIDAMSSGSDVIPILQVPGPTPETSEFRLGALNGWAVLGVSVTRTSSGATNSYWEAQATEPGGLGAEIVSYCLPGPQGIASSYGGQVFLEHSVRDFSIGTPTILEPQGAQLAEVVAYDPMMQYIIQHGGSPEVIHMTPNRFYFSLTPSSAIALGGDPWGFGPVDAASVYSVEWDGTADAWQPVEIAASAAELGLDPELDDIDALAVQGTGNSAPFTAMLFSTTDPSNPIVEMFQNGWTFAIPLVIETEPTDPGPTTGRTLPEQFDLDPSADVDSLCSLDPSELNGGVTLLSRGIGFPQEIDQYVGEYMTLSLGTTREGGVDDIGEFVHVVSGFGESGPRDGTLYLAYEIDQFPGMTVLGSIQRTASEFDVEYRIPRVAALLPYGPLSVTFYCEFHPDGPFDAVPSYLTSILYD